MTAYLEIRGPSGPQVVPLVAGTRVGLGRAPDNAVSFGDPLASWHHAVLEPIGDGWYVRDLGSRNGTVVAGDRIAGDRILRPGDELRLGATTVVFRSTSHAYEPTEGAPLPPELTRRERDVLRALCRPLFSGDPFPEPASMRRIASELVVTEAAVQQHLLRLYQKFGLKDVGAGRRRTALAREAVRRAAVTGADLRRDT